MTSPSPLHRLAAFGVAVTAVLSACSEPSDKKADTSSGVVTTLVTDTSSTTGSTATATASTVQPSLPSSNVPSSAAPPPPAKPRVELRGDDLAVTKVDAPFREAVEAVSRALGRPSADPTPDTSCVHADDEVEWSGFRLAANEGKVSGWASTRKDLKTPSEVTVGTTVAVLNRVYGDRLLLEPPNPDSGMTFAVRGVNLGGGLTGSASTDSVDYLFNGSCGPP